MRGLSKLVLGSCLLVLFIGLQGEAATTAAKSTSKNKTVSAKPKAPAETPKKETPEEEKASKHEGDLIETGVHKLDTIGNVIRGVADGVSDIVKGNVKTVANYILGWKKVFRENVQSVGDAAVDVLRADKDQKLEGAKALVKFKENFVNGTLKIFNAITNGTTELTLDKLHALYLKSPFHLLKVAGRRARNAFKGRKRHGDKEENKGPVEGALKGSKEKGEGKSGIVKRDAGSLVGDAGNLATYLVPLGADGLQIKADLDDFVVDAVKPVTDILTPADQKKESHKDYSLLKDIVKPKEEVAENKEDKGAISLLKGAAKFLKPVAKEALGGLVNQVTGSLKLFKRDLRETENEWGELRKKITELLHDPLLKKMSEILENLVEEGTDAKFHTGNKVADIKNYITEVRKNIIQYLEDENNWIDIMKHVGQWFHQ